MKTLVSVNEKGGVGKTALLNQLAFYFYHVKKSRILIVDTDTQKNTTYCQKKHKASIEMPGLTSSELFTRNITPQSIDTTESCIYYVPGDYSLADLEKKDINKAAKHFHENIKNLSASGFEYCFVDTAATIGTKLTATLLSADYIIAPIELEIFSITGVADLKNVIDKISKINKSLKFIGMIPNKVDYRNHLTKSNLTKLKENMSNLLIPHEIGNRTSISVATALGVPVSAIKKSAARVAAKEISAFSEYVYEKMQ